MELSDLPPNVAGASAAQIMGRRLQMEDRYCIESRAGAGLFAAVFDGHGGADVAEHLTARFPDIFFEKGTFERAFAKADEETIGMESGSTAVCAFLSDGRLTVANSGDARGLLVCGGDPEVKTLSRAHTVQDMEERARVLAAGARVAEPYYFKGNRGMIPTRSFGDRVMRDAGLISKPHITGLALPESSRYIILASDGLFDVLQSADILDELKSRPAAAAAAESLLRLSEQKGVSDNVTVVVIELK